VIVFMVANAAYGRQDAEEDRPDYTLTIDEFQDFCSLTMPSALSKSRKRHLSLHIAHQYVGQLPEAVRDAIFANCGTLVSFRVGAQDAPVLGRALDAPVDELKDLPRGRAWTAYRERGVRASAIPIDIPLRMLPTGHLERNT
jgi:TraM recognition site of TraD and TraG